MIAFSGSSSSARSQQRTRLVALLPPEADVAELEVHVVAERRVRASRRAGTPRAPRRTARRGSGSRRGSCAAAAGRLSSLHAAARPLRSRLGYWPRRSSSAREVVEQRRGVRMRGDRLRSASAMRALEVARRAPRRAPRSGTTPPSAAACRTAAAPPRGSRRRRRASPARSAMHAERRLHRADRFAPPRAPPPRARSAPPRSGRGARARTRGCGTPPRARPAGAPPRANDSAASRPLALPRGARAPM